MVRRLQAELELEETSQGVIVKGTGQIHSGLIQLAHDLPDVLSNLRGSPAQAFGIKGGRTRMQVLGVDPNEDSVCGQFAQTAEREGLSALSGSTGLMASRRSNEHDSHKLTEPIRPMRCSTQARMSASPF